MSALKKVLETRPRETSGAMSGNRFDFQKDWSLCLILELHQSSEDYLIIFDYHDDVIVLDCPDAPTKIRFYQIKSKKGKNWTLNQLISQKKSKDGSLLGSIIGKLYNNRLVFEDLTESLNLVSNALYSVKLLNGDSLTKTNINFAEVALIDRANVRRALKKEFALQAGPQDDDLINLIVTPLSIDDHASHAKGKLADFIEKAADPTIIVNALYRTIYAEISRKSTNEGIFDLEAEFKKRKALSRADFQDFLDQAVSQRAIDQVLRSIESEQSVRQLPIRQRVSMINNCRQVLIKLLNQDERLIQRAFRATREATDYVLKSSNCPASLTGILKAVTDDPPRELTELGEVYERSFLEALVAVAVYHE